jgi:hypothetical protein
MSNYNNDNNNIDYNKVKSVDDILKEIDVKYDMIRADLDKLDNKIEWCIVLNIPVYIYTVLTAIGILFK